MARKAAGPGRIAVQNRKARHNYFIEETIEAGIVLVGTEVKSLRDGRGNISEAFATDQNGELWLVNAHVSPYGPASRFGHDPKRPRKLLLHHRQLDRLLGAIQREGATLVPLSIYFNDRGIAKVELGLASGKKKHDKRASEKERDWQREKGRVLRARE